MSTEVEDMTDAWGETWDADDRVGLGPAPTVKADDPRPALTERQAMVAAAIHGLTKLRGVAPSLRELGSIIGVKSPTGLECHVKSLARKGYIRQPRPLVARDLVLLPSRKEAPC